MNNVSNQPSKKYSFKELKNFQGFPTIYKYKIVILFLKKWLIKNFRFSIKAEKRQ